jgi:hypothetical protein
MEPITLYRFSAQKGIIALGDKSGLKGHLLITRQCFADLLCAGFSVQMFIRRTEFPATTKLSAENETSSIANLLLAVRAFRREVIAHLLPPSLFLNF